MGRYPPLPTVGAPLVYGLDDPNITAVVARTGELHVVQGWDDRFDENLARPPDYPPDRVAYFIPIKTEERVFAVIATSSEPDERAATLSAIEAMSGLLAHTAVALSQAQLHQEVSDSRRYIQAVVESAKCLLIRLDIEELDDGSRPVSGLDTHRPLDAVEEFLNLDLSPASDWMEVVKHAQIEEDDHRVEAAWDRARSAGEDALEHDFRDVDRSDELR